MVFIWDESETKISHILLVQNLDSLCKKDLVSCYLTYKSNQKYIKIHGNTFILFFFFYPQCCGID